MTRRCSGLHCYAAYGADGPSRRSACEAGMLLVDGRASCAFVRRSRRCWGGMLLGEKIACCRAPVLDALLPVRPYAASGWLRRSYPVAPFAAMSARQVPFPSNRPRGSVECQVPLPGCGRFSFQ